MSFTEEKKKELKRKYPANGNKRGIDRRANISFQMKMIILK